MNTKIIDLLFEYKPKMPRADCINYIANFLSPSPYVEIEENYIEFEKHEDKMRLALEFFKSNDAYFAVHELANLFSWKFSLEYTWKMANYCKINSKDNITFIRELPDSQFNNKKKACKE